MGTRIRPAALAAVAAVALAGSAAPALATTITVTTPTSAPFAFKGMPAKLKAGTYTFKYVNETEIGHNLKVGSKATPVFFDGSRSVTVTLKKGTVKYECVPHASMMKGTIKVT